MIPVLIILTVLSLVVCFILIEGPPFLPKEWKIIKKWNGYYEAYQAKYKLWHFWINYSSSSQYLGIIEDNIKRLIENEEKKKECRGGVVVKRFLIESKQEQINRTARIDQKMLTEVPILEKDVDIEAVLSYDPLKTSRDIARGD